jgi:hypothetical protein
MAIFDLGGDFGGGAFYPLDVADRRTAEFED